MESAEKIAPENQALVDDCHVSRAVEMNSKHLLQNHGHKSKQIEEACQWKDTQRLRDLAVSEGGLLSDDIRRRACRLAFRSTFGYVLIISDRANSLGILSRLY